MALVDLLYRCPRCGHDPLPGKGGSALCPACGSSYSVARGGGILISGENVGREKRSAREVAGGLILPGHGSSATGASQPRLHGTPVRSEGPSVSPARTPEATDGPVGKAVPSGGESPGVIRETRARVKIASGETDIRFQGRILGFMEVFGKTREGRLRLDSEALAFRPDGGGDQDHWPLHRILSVQASSSSVQITTRETGLVSIKVPDESIHLWELLIHRALQATWHARGWGRILEFQPRIRAE